MDNRPYRRASLFWPIVLIGVGIFWLLGNLGYVSAANIGILFSLWPLILIALGLDILFGRRFPVIGALIGLATVALAVALVVWGPRLGLKAGTIGWGNIETVQTETFTEPLGPATAARVNLELESAPATVAALSDSNDLIKATLTHVGQIDFTVSGSAEKTIRLRQNSQYFGPHFWFGNGAGLRWDIGLTPKIPLDLEIDGGSGSATLDLAQLQLSALALDAGSGDVRLNLPAGSKRYRTQLSGGSGKLNVDIPAEASVGLDLRAASGNAAIRLGSSADAELQIAGGSGNLEIEVPAQAAVRVEVQDSGSGSVRVPAALTLVSGSPGQEGVWETAGFAQAARRITIIISRVTSGNIEVR